MVVKTALKCQATYIHTRITRRESSTVVPITSKIQVFFDVSDMWFGR